MRYLCTAAAVAFALSGGAALAQTSSQTAQPPAKSSMNQTAKSSGSRDHTCIMKAAQGGMAEVELGKLAADKASSDQVKQFGQKMVDDHGKANDELKTLAQNKNITLPADLDAKDKALKSRLEKLSGASFDRAYMQAMLKDHRADVSDFRKEANSGLDPDVKAFASKTLPTLESHLKLAQDDSKAVGTSGRMEAKPKAKTKKPSGR
jgi:putative membrane protein